MPLDFIPVTGTPPPGQACVWARTQAEIDQLISVVELLVAAMSQRPDRAAEDLSGGERYTLGVRAAARWTNGADEHPPADQADGAADARDRRQ